MVNNLLSSCSSKPSSPTHLLCVHDTAFGHLESADEDISKSRFRKMGNPEIFSFALYNPVYLRHRFDSVFTVSLDVMISAERLHHFNVSGAYDMLGLEGELKMFSK